MKCICTYLNDIYMYLNETYMYMYLDDMFGIILHK